MKWFMKCSMCYTMLWRYKKWSKLTNKKECNALTMKNIP